MLRSLIWLPIVIALAACGGRTTVDPVTGETRPTGLFAEFQRVKIEDAEAAIQIAKTAGDLAMERCATTIKTVAEENSGAPALVGVEIKGFISGVARARALERQVGEQLIDERVRMDCAVILIDTLKKAGRIGLSLTPIGNVIGAIR